MLSYNCSLKIVLPYGSPKWQMANGIMRQLSRRYVLPVFATGRCTNSKLIDGQAAGEGAFSLLMSSLTGGNLITMLVIYRVG